MHRVYENKSSHPICFCITTIVDGWRKHKWYTVDPGEIVNVEYVEHLQGPDSYQKAELFGLTLRKGSVQDIAKSEMPPDVLANMIPPTKVKKKRGRPRRPRR